MALPRPGLHNNPPTHNPHILGTTHVPKTTWRSRSPRAIWQASQPLKQFSAAAGPADRRPGPSSQCQPADRRVRTSGWKPVHACPPLPGYSLMGARMGGGRQAAEGKALQTQNSTGQDLAGLSILPRSWPSQTRLPLLLSPLPQWLFLALPPILGMLTGSMVSSFPPARASCCLCVLSLQPSPWWASAWGALWVRTVHVAS